MVLETLEGLAFANLPAFHPCLTSENPGSVCGPARQGSQTASGETLPGFGNAGRFGGCEPAGVSSLLNF